MIRSDPARRTMLVLAAAGLLVAGCSSTTTGGGSSPSSSAAVSVPATDGPGVTDDTIYLASVGGGDGAPATGEVDEFATKAVQGMGLTWPGGRTVQVLRVNVGQGGATMQERSQIICEQVRGMEQKVLAVVYDLMPGPLAQCLAEQGVMLVSNNVQMLPQDLAPNTLAVSTTVPVAPVPAAVVGDLAERGWFGQDPTTAVLLGNDPDQTEIVQEDTRNLTEALQRAGADDAQVLPVDTFDADEISSALLRLKADGVDHVLCWLCGAADAFAAAAAAQDYDPSFAVWDGTSVGAPFYDFKPAGWGPNARSSFVGYSSHPNWTLPQITQLLQGHEPTTKCLTASGSTVNLDSGGLATFVCMNPALIAAGLAAAPEGSGVNAQAAVAGLQSLTGEDRITWPGFGTLSFGPEQGSGGDELYVSRFDTGCSCLLSQDDPLLLDD